MRWAVNFKAGLQVDGAVNGRIGAWTKRLGALLWHPRCLLCAAPGFDDRDLCARCHVDLPWNSHACSRCAIPIPLPVSDGNAPMLELTCGACLRQPPAVTATHAAFVYTHPLDRLLPRLKFHQDMAAGRLLAQLSATALARAAQPDALVPIPLHRRRLRQRGYDQALELARPLARTLQLPLRDDLLIRHKATAPQSRLDAAARRRNLRSAFEVRAPSSRALKGCASHMPAHVALFDDVMTTGATLHAAANALHRAGVRRVDAWVCARVP